MHKVCVLGKKITDLLTAGAVQWDRYILTMCKDGLVHYSSKLLKNGRVSTTLGIYSTYCQNGYCLVSAVWSDVGAVGVCVCAVLLKNPNPSIVISFQSYIAFYGCTRGLLYSRGLPVRLRPQKLQEWGEKKKSLGSHLNQWVTGWASSLYTLIN